MDIWSWISELPNSDEWSESDSSPKFELASSEPGEDNSTSSIHLKAERTSGSDSEAVVTFTVCLQGFHPFNAQKPLWVSEKCHLSSQNPFLPLLLQLLQEIISLSPTAHDSTCPRSQLQKLKPEPIAWIMDSHTPESLSTFFNLVFTMRLFWLCVCDAPSEAGSLYFHSLLAPTLETTSSRLASILRTFFITVGVDTELCFMRTLGYIIAKWCIIRELGVGLQTLVPSTPCRNPKFSYAAEAHGLWVLKGYAPVMTMKLARTNGQKSQFPGIDAKESLLRYALAHHQLEAHVQLEYTVGFFDGFIQVNARVDNIRLHVVRLGFNQNDDVDFIEEKHFPSRIRVWVGPEIGAAYVAGLSLGRSTENKEGEVEIQKIVKGNFEKSEIAKVKASARTSRRTRNRSWRMDQEAEGNAAIFDVVLCDNMTGQEVGTWKPTSRAGDDPVHGLRGRYVGANRPFGKNGSVVIAGDEYGEEVGWRLSKEMEGSVLKWRIGGEFWVSYWPNQAKGSYFETRCVEWCDEVDLPLIRGKIP
ncbi:uncharacterized protein LOC133316168 [Gastrolobium bilobum]|uniref:uncharacterized protein LOC133316168 n=1 Tax=Gastrolobium bilobum TaxID=150636 RepID=UPI002AB0D78B|nr:uncharacterized protein LOC133316168 [Gastrolobium bilobum]